MSVLLSQLSPVYVSRFVPKVLTTLNAALGDRDPHVALTACNILSQFVRLLDEQILRSNLCAVVVSVLPLLMLYNTENNTGGELHTHTHTHAHTHTHTRNCAHVCVIAYLILLTY